MGVSPDDGRVGTGHLGGVPRVLLADDAVVLRQALAHLLEREGFEVVGQASTARELLELVAETQPDVVVTDVRMPPSHTDEGVRAAEEIAVRHPNIGIVVLSQIVEPRYALRLLSNPPAGTGYLLKDRVPDVETFGQILRTVAAGGTYVDRSVVETLMRRVRATRGIDALSERERDILTLMAEGRSNAAIAGALFVTEKAVSKHTNNIFAKLDLPQAPDDNRRVRAVLAWLGA
jgi:DNA-binding NarL/FixJ family response regulator